MTSEELRTIPLLEGLSDASLERLAASSVGVEVRGGFHAELGPGQFFGEVALLVPSGRVARVRAATRARCLSIPRETALGLLETEPSLSLKMLRELARRLSDVES